MVFLENSRLRCFVANFIADGFTRFLCYFFWAKSAFVLIFTLLECLEIMLLQGDKVLLFKDLAKSWGCGKWLKLIVIRWDNQNCKSLQKEVQWTNYFRFIRRDLAGLSYFHKIDSSVLHRDLIQKQDIGKLLLNWLPQSFIC